MFCLNNLEILSRTIVFSRDRLLQGVLAEDGGEDGASLLVVRMQFSSVVMSILKPCVWWWWAERLELQKCSSQVGTVTQGFSSVAMSTSKLCLLIVMMVSWTFRVAAVFSTSGNGDTRWLLVELFEHCSSVPGKWGRWHKGLVVWPCPHENRACDNGEPNV